MSKWIIAHARPVFWLWCLPMAVFLVWCATWMAPTAVLSLYFLTLLWMFAGFWGVNVLTALVCRPCFRALNETCDPLPLLQLCQSVTRQNPKALYYLVYEGYALSLLGRREEADQAAEAAGQNPRLWKRPSLLLVWCALLPLEDPRRARALSILEGRCRRMRGPRRTALETALDRLRILEQLPEAPDELEPRLLQALAQAACTREQVSAHLALGAYYAQRGNPAAETHLRFVLAHANRLYARTQAERLLCALPPQRQ